MTRQFYYSNPDFQGESLNIFKGHPGNLEVGKQEDVAFSTLLVFSTHPPHFVPRVI